MNYRTVVDTVCAGLTLLLVACSPSGSNEPRIDYGSLSSLTVSAGRLSPAFRPEITEYEVIVPNSIERITVTGVAAANDARVEGDAGIARDLAIGDTAIVLSLVLGDGTTKDYAVTARRLSFTLSMVDVPAGSFQRDEKEENVSAVSAFALGETEITRAQFADLMGDDPSDPDSSSGLLDPAQKINWYHAIAFCNKLSVVEGRAPVSG